MNVPTMRVLVPCFLVVLVTAAGAAEPRWSRVDTPDFVVVGTGSEKHLQTVGAQFEGFREALTRLLSATATSTAVPTIVVAFPDEKSFRPFKPVYQGKRVEIGGLFIPRRDVNFILIGPEISEDSLRGVFHEYSHLIISNVAPTIPVWLNEGLAEYYSSFELGSDGRKVLIGRPILPHLRSLNEDPFIPLTDLIATTHDSPQYNENSRRSMFYAEAWALVHMLLHGKPDRRPAFSAYAEDLGRSTPSDVAWAKHFGGEDISAALRDYTGRRVFMARQFTLPEKITKTPGTLVAWPPAMAEAAFGEILLALDQPDAAAARFEAALAQDPKSTFAALGAARASKRPAPAMSNADEDWLTSYLTGVALLDLADRDAATLAAARAALERAIAVHPEIPNVQVRYAEAVNRAGADASRAIDALKKAHAAVPARDDYTFALARALTQAGETAAARDLLGQVLARPHLPGARDRALELMRWVISVEQERRGRADRGPAPGGSQSPDPGRDVDTVGSVEIPVFREVRENESRIEGLLERIDCSATGVTVSVRAADRVARFQTARLDGIQFITYRTDLRGAVACGARTPPDRVYVTFRPGPLDGTVVAIEFLPNVR